jgi:hypothetical protein
MKTFGTASLFSGGQWAAVCVTGEWASECVSTACAWCLAGLSALSLQLQPCLGHGPLKAQPFTCLLQVVLCSRFLTGR